MTLQEQLEESARKYEKNRAEGAYHGFKSGALKGMEIQKEIDRHEIERLKDSLREIIRTRPAFGEYEYSNAEAIDEAEELLKSLES